MGRNWSPKYKCRCTKCGWRGKRTLRIMSNRCPKCGGYPVEKQRLGAASHLTALDFRTEARNGG
jgi:Zn finger protein HypA/HybF involved in hydrogenase expression